MKWRHLALARRPAMTRRPQSSCRAATEPTAPRGRDHTVSAGLPLPMLFHPEPREMPVAEPRPESVAGAVRVREARLPAVAPGRRLVVYSCPPSMPVRCPPRLHIRRVDSTTWPTPRPPRKTPAAAMTASISTGGSRKGFARIQTRCGIHGHDTGCVSATGPLEVGHRPLTHLEVLLGDPADGR